MKFAAPETSYDELETLLAAVFQVTNRDSQLLVDFTPRALLRGFPVFQFAARAVDLALADTGLLVDQQDFAVVDDEYQRGRDLGLPMVPVDVRQPFQND